MTPHIDGLIECPHEVLLLIDLDLSLRLLKLTKDLKLTVSCLLLGNVLPLLHTAGNIAKMEAVYSVADETVQD